MVFDQNTDISYGIYTHMLDVKSKRYIMIRYLSFEVFNAIIGFNRQILVLFKTLPTIYRAYV